MKHTLDWSLLNMEPALSDGRLMTAVKKVLPNVTGNRWHLLIAWGTLHEDNNLYQDLYQF
jgi:hypothetical protein